MWGLSTEIYRFFEEILEEKERRAADRRPYTSVREIP